MTSLFGLKMKPLINAFAKGMSDIIAPAWLGLFNAKEFNQVRLASHLYIYFSPLLFLEIRATFRGF